jgi:hypothetical protein
VSFRARITLLAAAAVAVAVVIASGVAFFEVRHQLYHQVDSTLKQPQRIDCLDDFGTRRPFGFAGDERYLQCIAPDGTVDPDHLGGPIGRERAAQLRDPQRVRR